MENADKANYGTLLNRLKMQMPLSNNQYAKTLLKANHVLGNFKKDNLVRQNVTIQGRKSITMMKFYKLQWLGFLSITVHR